MCKEYESPTRTVHAAVEKMAFERIHSRIPDLWEDEVAIYTKVDVIADKLDIDVELTTKGIGVSYEVKNITRKVIYGEWGEIQNTLDYVIREFGARTFIRV